MVQNIDTTAFARVGLLGNPSDGYHGKTISFSLHNFAAKVSISASDQIRILPSAEDRDEFASLDELIGKVQTGGYYGGVRLIKAAIVGFAEFAPQIVSESSNFEIGYSTNIPRNVGLAGSSAIVIASLRALARFYQIQIEPHLMASLALSIENRHLGIPAGLQDRVIQSYEGMVYMNFAQNQMREEQGLSFGQYERLDPASLQNLFVAYSHDAGEPTEVPHQNLRSRFEENDPQVVEAMQSFAGFAEMGKTALKDGNQEQLSSLIDRNFDLRSEICAIHPRHQQMIDTARSCGASAKFCGSGGAIVGVYPDRAALARLSDAFREIGCIIIEPKLATDTASIS